LYYNANANVNLKDLWGITAIDSALAYGKKNIENKEIIAMLQKAQQT